MSKRERHIRIFLAEFLDYLKKRVPGVAVGRGNRKLPCMRADELVANAPKLVGLGGDAPCYSGDGFPVRREPENPVSFTREDFKPKLVLQSLDLLADSRLGCAQRMRCLGNVEFIGDNGANVGKLGQAHGRVSRIGYSNMLLHNNILFLFRIISSVYHAFHNKRCRKRILGRIAPATGVGIDGFCPD